MIEMSKHLSPDQFAKCLAGRPTAAELQHAAECAECSARLDRFTNTMSLFRNALQGRIDDRIDGRVATHTPRLHPLPTPPASERVPLWRWALVAVAAVVLVVGPFLTHKKEAQEVSEKTSLQILEAPKSSAEALMNAVNLHLSRTVPEPMERMMTVIPNDESTNEPGGSQ